MRFLRNKDAPRQEGDTVIGSLDMVMLKRPGAAINGTSGNVHAFSAGPTQANVAGITPLLRTSDETGTATPFALPDNLGGNLTDYIGNRAGTVANAVFGRANNPANQRFLDSLRRTRTTSVRSSSPQALTISPMPASTECLVRFGLDAASSVSIVVTDVGGRQKELYRAVLAAGEQAVTVPLKGLAAGTYFLTVKMSGGEVSGRVVVR